MLQGTSPRSACMSERTRACASLSGIASEVTQEQLQVSSDLT